MSELFAAFGIDWRLLLIYSFNFGLLLAVLWRFLYAPIMRMLEIRQRKIAFGMKNAEEVREKLAEIESSRDAVLTDAGQEADIILANARKAGSSKELELVKAGEASAAHIISAADAEAREMKARAIAESKHEVAKLIVLGIEKTLKQS